MARGGIALILLWILFLALGAFAAAPSPPAAAPASSGRVVEVDMTHIEFRPTRVKLRPGDRIRFVNKDPFPHTALLVNAANPNAVVFPDKKVPGKTTYTTPPIRAKGVFTLYCTIHGGMKARVTTTGDFRVTEAMRRAVAAALPPEVKEGEALFWGKAQCFRCHSMGKRGEATRGPNLEDIGLRARSRAKDRRLGSATGYLVESLLEPGAYVVAGYVDDMEKVYQPPLDLGKADLVRLIAYLQSQSGKVDTWSIDIPQAKLDRPAPSEFPVKGDPEEGRAFFMEEAECAKCHRVGEKGGGLGPELTHIGAYRDQAFLLREILNPDAVVAPGFWGIELTPKNRNGEPGKALSGILVRETPEAYVVKFSDESVKTFPKSRVKRASVGKGSTMPHYADALTAQQVADLLAFLQNLEK